MNDNLMDLGPVPKDWTTWVLLCDSCSTIKEEFEAPNLEAAGSYAQRLVTTRENWRVILKKNIGLYYYDSETHKWERVNEDISFSSILKSKRNKKL